jgi:hypothetical protein
MNNFWRIIAVAVLVLVLIALYWTRYQVIPVNYAYAPAFYKINRMSGEITLTVGKEFVQVKEIDEKMTAPPAPAPGPATAPGPAPAPGNAAPPPAPGNAVPKAIPVPAPKK